MMFYKASRNNARTRWTLKLDIKKFFANIDHEILKNILVSYISDQDIMWLLVEIIDSFPQGLPLGNLTSQLFVNIYLNQLDQFVKHKLKVQYYIRYADDFVILSPSKHALTAILSRIAVFLENELKLTLHPNKIILKTFASGLDFLGWVNFPTHRVLRTATRRRMFKRLNPNNLQSYFGLMKHGNTGKLLKLYDHRQWQ